MNNIIIIGMDLGDKFHMAVVFDSDTFVKNNAGLLPRGIRINVVSPAPIIEAGQEQQGTVTAAQTAELFVKSVEGNMTGRILRAWGGLPYNPE